MKDRITLVIHGGAGTISPSSMTRTKEREYRKALKDAASAGYRVLLRKGSAEEAVTQAICHLEDCPLFNAGKGSVYNHDGIQEMDAAIMTGKNLNAGSVAAVRGVKNPILLAREIMNQSKYVFLSGEGAAKFARERSLEMRPTEYFYSEYRYQQWQKAHLNNSIVLDHDEPQENKKFGTVGAVALDVKGNLAAGSSTGGMTNKNYGRIGDSPVIGSGIYAHNKNCAVSATGHGEYFLRLNIAYRISALMEYKGLSLEKACNEAIQNKLVKMGGRGGVIALDRNGSIQMNFSTKGMYRAFRSQQLGEYVGIYRD